MVKATTHCLFSRTTQVEIAINATKEHVWQILCDLEHYENWNPTVLWIKGKFEKGNKIELISTLAPKKKFSLRVKEIVPYEKITIGSLMGSRSYSLNEQSKMTTFTMTETLKSPLLPFFIKYIPSFDDSFKQFAAALKNACEQRQSH